MPTGKPSPLVLASAACATILLLLFLGLRSSFDGTSRWGLLQAQGGSQQDAPYAQNSAMASKHESAELGRAGNRTLGFGKILVLGLKERSDKRDAMVLASSLTGFDVEFIDGVIGDEVPEKVLPLGLTLKAGHLGSWRSHMNAVRSVIESGLSSVMIMEDDADWDVRLLSQMAEFAKGVRYVAEVPLDKHQESPYSDDWDILWPGHCGEAELPWAAEGADDRLYIIKNDTTVAPKEHLTEVHLLGEYPEGVRIVHRGVRPICTFAYALSRRGAQKILASMALKSLWNFPFDLSLALTCQAQILGLKCYSVEPMLFYHHRPAGPTDRNSDIKVGPGEKEEQVEFREKGFTENIVWSARLNMEQMITGSEVHTMQW